MSTKVIVFVGMPGSGKSLCVEYLQQKNLPSVYFGGITIDEIKNRGMEVNEANEKMVREDIRAKEGKGAYAQRIIAKIDALDSQGHDKIVVDGLYSWTEYKIFKEKFGNEAVIIAIASPRSERHKRLASRPVRPLNDEEVTSREYAEIENLEKGGPIANADFTILNNSTAEELLARLMQTLKEADIAI